MCLLPDHEIDRRCARATSTPLIEPYHSEQLQAASYDLRLGRQFRFPGPNTDTFVTKSIIATPGKLLLGVTMERISLPFDLAGQIEGKSGLARRGLQIEAAGHGDPGYVGTVTLELYNLGEHPIMLEEGMLVAKVLFHTLTTPCLVPYSAERNHHQYAHGPIP